MLLLACCLLLVACCFVACCLLLCCFVACCLLLCCFVVLLLCCFVALLLCWYVAFATQLHTPHSLRAYSRLLHHSHSHAHISTSFPHTWIHFRTMTSSYTTSHSLICPATFKLLGLLLFPSQPLCVQRCYRLCIGVCCCSTPTRTYDTLLRKLHHI